MIRLLILDGIDLTGKSWCASRLQQLRPNIGFCAFPSKELCESQDFARVATEKTTENVLVWLGRLYTEEYAVLSEMLVNYKQIVIDRFWLSTLLYQGDGEPNFHFEIIINRIYERLMFDLGLEPEHMINIVFRYPLVHSDNAETNKTKKFFDSKQRELYQKLNDLLPRICNSLAAATSSKYFRYLEEFSEPYLGQCWGSGKEPNVDVVKAIQDNRINEILKLIPDATDEKKACEGE